MPTPHVSVVIPTRDAGPLLGEVLAALDAQRGAPPFEVVAVDSGSTDGTVARLAGRVDRLVEVPPGEFDHGLTRNAGIAAARGELVVLLVQDAVPAGPGWLAALVAPFAADPRLAGAFARQVPRPGASRLARAALARAAVAGERGWTAELAGAAELAALTPGDRLRRCTFDDVCSCLRSRVWEEHPFRATPIAEDLAWAREVLLAGWRVAFVPAATVRHSHERSPGHELRRTRLLHRRLAELFGLRLVPTLPALARAVAATLADHARILALGDGPRPRPGEAARALALAVAWPLGQYLGARDAGRGDA